LRLYKNELSVAARKSGGGDSTAFGRFFYVSCRFKTGQKPEIFLRRSTYSQSTKQRRTLEKTAYFDRTKTGQAIFRFFFRSIIAPIRRGRCCFLHNINHSVVTSIFQNYKTPQTFDPHRINRMEKNIMTEVSQNKILLINEVAERLRVSTSTVNRWLGLARKGESTFPLPISATGGKGRWLAESIDRWLESQAIATSPVPTKTKRRNDRAQQARQAATDRALERFRTKTGGGR
jgi:predicted DNA-binding transcriptional regulator AlpA